MEHLPYIDEHRIPIAASREHAWAALPSVLRRHFGATLPGPVTRLWGLRPAQLRGDWSEAPRPGDSLPGFEVAEVQGPERLALRGQHQFSRYALVFEFHAVGAADCTLSARTWAEFPGRAGRAYRTIVIGTGGHRLLLRRLLRNVARRA